MAQQTNTIQLPDEPAPAWQPMIIRGIIAIAAGIIAIRVGLGYIHLCLAGSKMIEWFAVAGSPILCIAAVVLVRRYVIVIPLVALYVLALKLLCEPYLDWIHGPSSPWHGL